MQISFQTKEESKEKQLEAFLKLPKTDRFFKFLILSRKINKFPKKKFNRKNKNFEINFYNHK